MSVVSNCILSFSIGEEEEEIILKINSFLIEIGRGAPFISCDSVDEGLWYGGSKHLETPLYIGAFNCFDLDGFMTHLNTIDFDTPESVQLIIKEQDSDVFEIKTLDVIST